MITRDEVDSILAGLDWLLVEGVEEYINNLENEIAKLKQKPKTKTTYVYHYCAEILNKVKFIGLYNSENMINCDEEINKLKELITKGAKEQGIAITNHKTDLGITSLTFLHTTEEPC
jgi:hypothetical protein